MPVIEADLLVLESVKTFWNLHSTSTSKKSTCMQDPLLITVTSHGEKLNDARFTASPVNDSQLIKSSTPKAKIYNSSQCGNLNLDCSKLDCTIKLACCKIWHPLLIPRGAMKKFRGGQRFNYAAKKLSCSSPGWPRDKPRPSSLLKLFSRVIFLTNGECELVTLSRMWRSALMSTSSWRVQVAVVFYCSNLRAGVFPGKIVRPRHILRPSPRADGVKFDTSITRGADFLVGSETRKL